MTHCIGNSVACPINSVIAPGISKDHAAFVIVVEVLGGRLPMIWVQLLASISLILIVLPVRSRGALVGVLLIGGVLKLLQSGNQIHSSLLRLIFAKPIAR